MFNIHLPPAPGSNQDDGCAHSHRNRCRTDLSHQSCTLQGRRRSRRKPPEWMRLRTGGGHVCQHRSRKPACHQKIFETQPAARKKKAGPRSEAGLRFIPRTEHTRLKQAELCVGSSVVTSFLTSTAHKPTTGMAVVVAGERKRVMSHFLWRW